MGLGQLEKLDWFVNKRIQMAKMYLQVINDLGCKWLVPQQTPRGDVNSYYTFSEDDKSWILDSLRLEETC